MVQPKRSEAMSGKGARGRCRNGHSEGGGKPALLGVIHSQKGEQLMWHSHQLRPPLSRCGSRRHTRPASCSPRVPRPDAFIRQKSGRGQVHSAIYQPLLSSSIPPLSSSPTPAHRPDPTAHHALRHPPHCPRSSPSVCTATTSPLRSNPDQKSRRHGERAHQPRGGQQGEWGVRCVAWRSGSE